MAKKLAQFDVHPGVAVNQRWIATLKERTGRSLEEWLKIVRASKLETPAERREWLKAEHGLGTNNASWFVDRATGKGEEDDDPEKYLKAAALYVERMFEGKKEHLKPVADALIAMGRRLGTDVKVCPCQTMVPLYRNHVFGQVKPTTQTRIDLGLALKDTKVPKRLIDTGGLAKKDRITHRIEITSVEEIDEFVERWMRKAYEMDGA
jgi:hypothetical protein